MKTCSFCKENKPLTTEFWHKNTNGRLGFRSTCKICTNKDNRARHVTSKNKWAQTRKNGYLKRHYGITLAEYNNILAKQNFQCKICLTKTSGRKTSKFLSVDHCHKTGKVRGILCSTCNSTVGFIERTLDSKTTLQNLIKYLNL